MSSSIQPASNIVLNFQAGITVYYTASTQTGAATTITITDSTGKPLVSMSGSGVQTFIGQGSFVTTTPDIKVTIIGNNQPEKAMVQDYNIVNGGTLYLTGYTVVSEDWTDADYNDVTLQLWANSRKG